MAFDHWWIGLVVDESDCEALRPDFATAAAKAHLSPASHQALAAWRGRSSDFDEDATMSDEAAAALADAFIWAFNLPGYGELAEQLLTKDGKFTALVTEERMFRMIMAARHSPVSIVWQALGHDRAERLPGQMGNMLLHPREVEKAYEQTRRAYAGTSQEHLLEDARRYCGASVSDDTLLETINFLPDGLAQAQNLNRGFLALARPQI